MKIKKLFIGSILFSGAFAVGNNEYFHEFVYTPEAIQAHTNFLEESRAFSSEPSFREFLRCAVFKLSRLQSPVSVEEISKAVGDNCPEAYLHLLENKKDDLNCLVNSYNHFKRLNMKTFYYSEKENETTKAMVTFMDAVLEDDMNDLLLSNENGCVQEISETESLIDLKKILPQKIESLKLVNGLFYLKFWPMSPADRGKYIDLYLNAYEEGTFPWSFIWAHLDSSGLKENDQTLFKSGIEEFTAQYDLIKKYMVLVAAYLHVISKDQRPLHPTEGSRSISGQTIKIFQTHLTSFCTNNNIYLNGKFDGDKRHIESVVIYGPKGGIQDLEQDAIKKRIWVLSFFHEVGHLLVHGLVCQNEKALWKTLFLGRPCPNWKDNETKFSNYILDCFKILREILSSKIEDSEKLSQIECLFLAITGQDVQQTISSIYNEKIKDLIAFVSNQLVIHENDMEKGFPLIEWGHYGLNSPNEEDANFKQDFQDCILNGKVENVIEFLRQCKCTQDPLVMLSEIVKNAIKTKDGKEVLEESAMEFFSPTYTAFVDWREACQITGFVCFFNKGYLNMFSDAILATCLGGYIRISHNVPVFRLSNLNETSLNALPESYQKRLSAAHTFPSNQFDINAIRDIVSCTYSILNPNFNFDASFEAVTKSGEASGE